MAVRSKHGTLAGNGNDVLGEAVFLRPAYDVFQFFLGGSVVFT